MKSILSFVVLVLISGCATSPINPEKASPVPTERLLAYQENNEGYGVLVVTRDTGYLGGGCFSGFFINGELAARFSPGEVAKFFVPAGEVLLKTSVDPHGRALCGVGKDHWTQRETIMKPGEKKTFRLSLSTSGKLDVQRMD